MKSITLPKTNMDFQKRLYFGKRWLLWNYGDLLVSMLVLGMFFQVVLPPES